MALVYATLIIKNPKVYTFAKAPDVIKEQVREILLDLGLGGLIEE